MNPQYKTMIVSIILALLLLDISVSGHSGTRLKIDIPAEKITGRIIIENNVYEILRFLSDEIGSRLTGSKSAHKAAEFCVQKFKEFGLSNVHMEYFPALGWLPGETSASVLEPYPRDLTVASMGVSINTPPQGLTSELIDAGHGSEAEFRQLGAVVKNKIILCGAINPPPGEKSTKELEKIGLAATYGASACIIISSYKGKLIKTRTSNNADYSPIPAAGTTMEDGTWMRRLIKSGNTLKVRLNIQNKIVDFLQSENIIADIPGTKYPEQMVILGAHLDTWDLGPGAADNGSGTAIVLETARILNSIKWNPKRTIRFILFTAEEQGLIGSKIYVKKHFDELDNISLMVNLDISGIMYPSFLNPYGGWKPDKRFRELLHVLHGFDIYRIEQRYPFDSDDFNFVVKGVPAMGIHGKGLRPLSYAHTAADTFDKIEPDKLNLTTAAVAILICFAASTEEPVAIRQSEEEVRSFFKKNGLLDRFEANK